MTKYLALSNQTFCVRLFPVIIFVSYQCIMYIFLRTVENGLQNTIRFHY